MIQEAAATQNEKHASKQVVNHALHQKLVQKTVCATPTLVFNLCQIKLIPTSGFGNKIERNLCRLPKDYK